MATLETRNVTKDGFKILPPKLPPQSLQLHAVKRVEKGCKPLNHFPFSNPSCCRRRSVDPLSFLNPHSSCHKLEDAHRPKFCAPTRVSHSHSLPPSLSLGGRHVAMLAQRKTRRRRAHIEEESSQAPLFLPPLGQVVIHFSSALLSTSQPSYSPRSLSSMTLSHAASSILDFVAFFF
ncbi:hypothetical protein S245_046418 [Arachis hypogaea]